MRKKEISVDNVLQWLWAIGFTFALLLFFVIIVLYFTHQEGSLIAFSALAILLSAAIASATVHKSIERSDEEYKQKEKQEEFKQLKMLHVLLVDLQRVNEPFVHDKRKITLHNELSLSEIINEYQNYAQIFLDKDFFLYLKESDTELLATMINELKSFTFAQQYFLKEYFNEGQIIESSIDDWGKQTQQLAKNISEPYHQLIQSLRQAKESFIKPFN